VDSWPLPPSWVQILSSAPCSLTPWIYAPPSVWEAKFQNHMKKRQNYGFIYFKLQVSRQETGKTRDWTER
jgi:hypothetical protein